MSNKDYVMTSWLGAYCWNADEYRYENATVV